jgi:hypothetical protein
MYHKTERKKKLTLRPLYVQSSVHGTSIIPGASFSASHTPRIWDCRPASWLIYVRYTSTTWVPISLSVLKKRGWARLLRQVPMESKSWFSSTLPVFPGLEKI